MSRSVPIASPTPRPAATGPMREPDLESPLLDEVLDRTARRLDEAAARYAQEIDTEGLGHLRRAMLLANAMERLGVALDPLRERMLALMNSPLGFLTDRDPSRASRDGKTMQPYPWEVVRRCIVQALLAGFWPVGNEFNIIAGKFYPAKNGWERKVREYPGLTDLDVRPGIPRVDGVLTCVRVGAAWKINGIRQELLGGDGKPGRSFAIIVAGPSTPDTTVGKALAKAYRAIYQRISGSVVTEADEEEPAPSPAPADTTALEGALELERQNLIEDLGTRIKLAETEGGLAQVEHEVAKHADFLGADMLRALVEEIEERRREIGG